MFTGLVEKTGSISAVQTTDKGAKIIIDIPFSDELSIGDSVAINGCCLTVSAIDKGQTSFDLLAQTLKVTALNELNPGLIVNLERALIAGHRIGGHLLTGHIDTVSEIITYMPMGEDGMGEMGIHIEEGGMPIPDNSLPMVGGYGPFDYITMGGMFTLLKVRSDLTSYQDPGWYQHLEGTVASLISTEDRAILDEI